AAALAEGIPDGPGAMALRCALDVAMLDLRARTEGCAVAALLSEGEPPSWVQANAVIGNGSPEEVARYAQEAWGSGYRVLKLKVGAARAADDVARVRAVREACPEAVIRLDANGAWDEATALEAIAGLAPLHVELLEQPVS